MMEFRSVKIQVRSRKESLFIIPSFSMFIQSLKFSIIVLLTLIGFKLAKRSGMDSVRG
jgi:hypothetical protein